MLDERTATASLDRLSPPGVLETWWSGSFVECAGRPVPAFLITAARVRG